MADKQPPSRGAKIAAAVTLCILAVPVLILIAGLTVRLASWAF